MPALTKDQFAILSRYGSGMDVDSIVKHTGLNREFVSQTLMNLATMNRPRAGQLAREYDTARRNEVNAAAPKPAAGTVEDLLAAAEASGVPKLNRAADRIRGLVADLRTLMRESEKERVLRASIVVLRKQLDQTSKELRELTRKPAKATQATPADSPSPRELRAWAAANGVECPAMGIVPKRVREAYDAAHGQAADA